jgi:UDP-N-acetylmuramyl pentapeptide phosphotransferase/UDP-N-acetylglucosamine-1-phosphate transferase
VHRRGSLKTNALIALIVPLVVLAVPVPRHRLRGRQALKYRRPVYVGDANHFHHRFARIGFSQRRTVPTSTPGRWRWRRRRRAALHPYSRSRQLRLGLVAR